MQPDEETIGRFGVSVGGGIGLFYDQTQRHSISHLYGTALAIQTFDNLAVVLADVGSIFLLVHTPEGCVQQLRKRVVQDLFFQMTMACWFLRDSHIRFSRMGRIIGVVFAPLSALSAWFHVRDAMYDGYGVELFGRYCIWSGGGFSGRFGRFG
ncbi:hypothetical protein BJY00DRAFT_310395 [Aspergillus carlsbadensis]|nr:hypothetical protein BJY00DRAFT_310395 [Aspergillus carlsbadensis]